MERSRPTDLPIKADQAVKAEWRWPLGVVQTATTVAVVLIAAIAMAAQETSQTRTTPQTYDELLVRVEARAPGFGGMFVDKDGWLVVYLKNPFQLAAARSAIKDVFGAQQVPAAGVRAKQGQYTVSQLKRWKERAAGLLEMAGVTTVDLDEANNRVAIGIEDESRRSRVEQESDSLSIPRAAIVIEVTGQIRPFDRSRFKHHRP